MASRHDDARQIDHARQGEISLQSRDQVFDRLSPYERPRSPHHARHRGQRNPVPDDYQAIWRGSERGRQHEAALSMTRRSFRCWRSRNWDPVGPALLASLASRAWNRNIIAARALAQRLRGFAAREACYDPSTSGRRVPYGRHYERHFPDRGRSFHPGWIDLKGARSRQRAADANGLALHEPDG